jgi:NADPH:quinone reductase-like Zn-dependent oxidoreductase
MITARKWVAAGLGGPEVLRNIEADVPDPGPGQVTIGVRACGMNPADAKHIAPGQDPGLLPLSIGYEVAGIVQALGPDTQLASGGGAPGDEVVAQVTGGYTTAITRDHGSRSPAHLGRREGRDRAAARCRGRRRDERLAASPYSRRPGGGHR